MVFSSSLFLFAFFPVFFITYFVVPGKLKNAVVITGSLFFYAWGAHSFILIVLITSIMDYQFGKIIYKTRTKKNRVYRICVIADLVINFGVLLYFKYTNFFFDNVNSLFKIMGLNPFTFTRIVLPIGISFIVFQKVTYCLDIAKGTTAPAKAYWYFLEYLLIFPQIIAGPIVKYNDISAQIAQRTWSHKTNIEGFKRFAIGLFKKVWIADVLANYADIAFNGPSNMIPIHYAWFGMLCYTFQIYFDFSSYSDMAIGLLKVMGFTISENFNFPYISKSITEFWKRWHISLTSWMREYLYIPLGGNRKGHLRAFFNQWIVFLISGFWHGANWNFIIWGAYHGSLLCIEKAGLLKKAQNIPGILRLIATFFFVNIGWVIFRADGFYAGLKFIRQMFNFSSVMVHTDPARIMVVDNRGIIIFFLACFICILPFFEIFYNNLKHFFTIHAKSVLVCCFLLFILSAVKIGTGNLSPFIYFRF